MQTTTNNYDFSTLTVELTGMLNKKMDNKITSFVKDNVNVEVSPFEQKYLRLSKAAYSTRRVPQQAMKTLLTGDITPEAGDLVLAEVINIRQHKRIELACGRRAHLHNGDYIILCYGNRYAPDQFEAYLPQDLGVCHMVAAGGVAAKVKNKHRGIKAATEIKPVGIIGDDLGRPLNIRDWAIEATEIPETLPEIYVVVGTSMNAGKTTTAAHLIKGLTRSGKKVGAAKLTGTGAGLDVWLMKDSGVHKVIDFTDAGHVSTFCLPIDTLERIYETLLADLCDADVDCIVFEIADGLIQPETAALLNSEKFSRLIDHIIFAAQDAMGAKAGVDWLRNHQLPVKAVSGALTASPMAAEEARKIMDLPVLDLDMLSSSEIEHVFGPLV